MTKHTHPCRRCHGMMVKTYSDLLSPSDTGHAVFVWRCVNCGNYVDRDVLQNRLAEGEGMPVRTSVLPHNTLPRRLRPILAEHRMEAA